jgi:hypothetical protein
MQFAFIIEPKEDVTGEGVELGMPAPADAALWMENLLLDWSRHEGQIGWRITRVIPVDDGGPG